MKLSGKLNHRNLDGMFRLILLTYGEKMRRNVSKLM